MLTSMTLEQRTQNTHLIRFFFFQFCINQQKLTLLSEGCSGEVFWPRLDAFSTEHTRSGSVGMREGQASERRFIKSVPNLVASSGSVGLAIGYPFGVLLPSERTHHFATPTTPYSPFSFCFLLLTATFISHFLLPFAKKL